MEEAKVHESPIWENSFGKVLSEIIMCGKARLVVKGFIKHREPSTIKVVISLVVSHKWDVRQNDVNNDFLDEILAKDVFMQPEGFIDLKQPKVVYKLN